MKLHEILFWFLILLLPTQLGRHFWPDFSLVFGIRIDYLSPTVYLTDLLVIAILGLWGIEKLKIKNEKVKMTIKNLKILVLPTTISLFLLANCFLAQNPGAAFYKFAKLIEFSLLGFYIAKNNYTLYATTKWQAVLIRYTLPLAIVYSSLIAIAQFFKQASLGGIFYWFGERTFNIQTPGIALGELGGKLFLRPYGTFSHPNSMAGFTLVALILLLGNFKSTNQQINKLVFILGLSALVLSFSRAAWLVGALMAYCEATRFTYGLWKRGIKKKILLLTIGCLLVTLFAGFSFLGMNQKPVQERIGLIQASLEMTKSNLISGVGLNNFIVRLPDFWQESSIRFLQPVHNIYLLIAAETGLVGLLIFFWLVFLTYKKLLSPLPTSHFSLLTGLTAILALGLFDHYWLTLQQNQFLFAIVLGMCWNETTLK